MDQFTFNDPTGIPEWFWEIIEKAGGSKDKLLEILLSLEKTRLFDFDKIYTRSALLLSDPVFTERHAGISEDGVTDVTEWVVAQGHSYYMQIWNNPELMPHFPEDGAPLACAIFDAYIKRFGEIPPEKDSI